MLGLHEGAYLVTVTKSLFTSPSDTAVYSPNVLLALMKSTSFLHKPVLSFSEPSPRYYPQPWACTLSCGPRERGQAVSAGLCGHCEHDDRKPIGKQGRGGGERFSYITVS